MKLFLFLIMTAAATVAHAKQKRPNIVWILSEDNSPLIGAYGDPIARTPNIDSLANDGIMFTQAYANAPVCAPSRSTLMNGVYANELGSEHMRSLVPLPDSYQHLPWYLKQAGYFTTNRLKKDYNTPLKDDTWSKDNWWDWKDAFDGYDGESPFFLMYNTWMSHEGKIHRSKNDNPLSYFEASLSAFGIDPAEGKAIHDSFAFDPASISLPAYHPDTPDIREDWALYYQCISLMDYEVGLVLKELQKAGRMDDTIVFYFSDHGGVLPRSKRFIYESGLRVPMAVHVPEQYKHFAESLERNKDSVLQFVDLGPTLLELADVDVPEHFSGVSLLTPPEERPSYNYSFRGRMDERYDMVRSVFDGRFRYVRDYIPHRPEGGYIRFMWQAPSVRSWENEYKAGRTNPVQSRFWEPNEPVALYDCVNDPDNVVNLADDPAYAEHAARLSAELDRWMLEIRDTGLIPEPMICKLRGEASPRDWVRQSGQDFEKLLEAANRAIKADPDNLETLLELSRSKDPAIRFWASQGLAMIAQSTPQVADALHRLAVDPFPSVQVAAAEGLYLVGDADAARATLAALLEANRHVAEANQTLFTHEETVVVSALNIIDLAEENPTKIFPEIRELVQNPESYSSWLSGYLVRRSDERKNLSK
jgi:arylsulfatase A-like enzyme